MSDQPNLSDVPPPVFNPNGTITRPSIPITPADPGPDSPSPVLTKDVPLNPQNSTWVRIFLPKHALNSSKKLPLLVYYHGGGFILASAANTVFHNFCTELAIQLHVVVVSVEYRLAPEHRLPAAYDDAVEALHWIKTPRDTWLRDFADLSNCFLAGDSAGANIAYHAGLRAAVARKDLGPLRIRGLILHQPFFSGSQRTESEQRSVNDEVIPLHSNDLAWELSLPIGADRDHEYSNPTVGTGLGAWEEFMATGGRIMVTGRSGDPLVDRQREFVAELERKGVDVTAQFWEGGRHGMEIWEPITAKPLFDALKGFLSPFCSST